MKRAPQLGTLFALGACLSLVAVPAFAQDQTPADKGNGFSITDETYLRTYERCWKALKAECGRNIVDDQLASGKPPSEAQVEDSTATMQRWLAPPEPVVVSTSTEYVPTTTTTVAPAPTSTGGCTGMEAESGSAGYDAYNPNSGAAGCYQIIPSTAAAHGCDLSTPGGQDACAQAICATQGPSAWSASGANPC